MAVDNIYYNYGRLVIVQIKHNVNWQSIHRYIERVFCTFIPNENKVLQIYVKPPEVARAANIHDIHLIKECTETIQTNLTKNKFCTFWRSGGHKLNTSDTNF